MSRQAGQTSPMRSRAEADDIDGISRRGDVEVRTVPGELDSPGIAPDDLAAQRVRDALVGDVELGSSFRLSTTTLLPSIVACGTSRSSGCRSSSTDQRGPRARGPPAWSPAGDGASAIDLPEAARDHRRPELPQGRPIGL